MAIRVEWATVSEDLTSQVNGQMVDFVIAQGEKMRPGTARVEINGIPQVPDENFVELNETTIRLTLSFVLRPPDQLKVWYVPQ